MELPDLTGLPVGGKGGGKGNTVPTPAPVATGGAAAVWLVANYKGNPCVLMVAETAKDCAADKSIPDLKAMWGKGSQYQWHLPGGGWKPEDGTGADRLMNTAIREFYEETGAKQRSAWYTMLRLKHAARAKKNPGSKPYLQEAIVYQGNSRGEFLVQIDSEVDKVGKLIGLPMYDKSRKQQMNQPGLSKETAGYLWVPLDRLKLTSLKYPNPVVHLSSKHKIAIQLRFRGTAKTAQTNPLFQ